MAGFDHRIILAGQTPDIVDTYNKSYDIGRKRAIEDQAIVRSRQLNESINSWDKSKPLSQHLIESGFADEGYDYGKKEADLAKSQADTSKLANENHIKKLEALGQINQGLLSLPNVNKETILGEFDRQRQLGIIDDNDMKMLSDKMANLPDNDQALRGVIQSSISQGMKTLDFMKYQRPDANAQLTAKTQMRNKDLDYSLGQQNYSLNSRKADFDNQMNMARLNLDKQDKEFKQGLDLRKENKGQKAVNQGALDSIDTAMESLQTIIDHPGRSRGTGFSSVIPSIPGGDAAGFDARLETFKAQTFVPMVAQLKGMGALSDAEGKKLTAAVGALDPKMPEEEFLRSARDIMRELELKKRRAQGDNSPRGASDGWDDEKINRIAQKHGIDPEEVRAFKASRGR